MIRKMAVKDILKKYNLLVLLLVFVAISSLISKDFFKWENFMNLWQQCSITGIIAIGMTFTIIVGGIDLSVGSVAAFTGMLAALFIKKLGFNIELSILISVAAGCVLGFISGIVITRFRLPPFIVTMAMMVSARGLALLITEGKVISGLPESFSFIGNGKLFLGIPVSGVIWVLLTVIAVLILKYTLFGRGMYALGGNSEAAYLSGVRIKTYNTLCYVISGGLSAFAGVMLTSWLTVGQPTIAQGEELNAIAATVLGGTSLSGGTGGVVGTLAGVFLMQIITNIFNLMLLPSYFQQIFMGIIIVLALLLNMIVIQKED